MRNKEFQRNLLTILTTAIIIIVGGGIYLYYSFFRQVNAQLMETIPTDAAFLFQINDNETFLKTTKKIYPHINPLFGLDAYPGCQFFVDQLPGKYNQVVFSGHPNGEKLSILFACKIHEKAFKQLLKNLQIDQKNCITFERCNIYTFGTHLKRFVFTYHKGIFLASENLTLLKMSITQLKNPKNLTTLKSFAALFNLTEKNKKQNWLILNHEKYFSLFQSFFNDETNTQLTHFSLNVPWAAHQVRFSGSEMLLTGYATPVLPFQNDYEIAIHDAKAEYWNEYLSELGTKKFPVAQIRSLTFSLDSLKLGLWMANGGVRF